ncbi:hypothetical protein Vretimale_17103 [Volvox reticuliferus]|uniref:RING-type domain-containing protein n=1 Tax=Volvox reticuliferus TaxID=1737510 RepID=A0A8J4GU44_9CHLO|nr:hypothetical protein Vretifemale_18640 [Volvox reticuliferus]GIM14072.1 hypothetical protein Vretimale_17103 [Volvox reticuliferus]
MTCFCIGRGSFKEALRKGDVAVALAHLENDPLFTARAHFSNGDTLWHIAAAGGHLPLLQAIAARLSAVWPTPDQPVVLQPNPPFQRRSNPFQRISDGLRGRVPDPSRLPLAAFVNTPNLLGQTALMRACKRGHTGCIQFLLSIGANAWYRDRANCTVLHYATLHDQGACIEVLLQHPSSARPPAGTRQSLVRLVDLPNFCGYTAAHFAAIAHKPRAMAALLAGGANIAARCWSEGNDWISGPAGSTPLHLAARRGDIELCKMVMSHYLEILRDNGTPDPRLHSDARGMQPYHRAAERGCRELAEMLMPSTPLSYIFGSDIVRLYKVPKLNALASAALQTSLLTQINEREAEATERRQLATQAAVAAARTAAAGVVSSGGGGSVTGAGPGSAVDPVPVGGSAAAAAAADRKSISRASSLVNDAIRFVRRQSLGRLDSLRRRLHGSEKLQGPEFSQELRGISQQLNHVEGGSEAAAGAQAGFSGYGGGRGGGAGTISGASGTDSYTAATATWSTGHPVVAFANGMILSRTSAAVGAGPAVEYDRKDALLSEAANGTAATGAAPLLLAGSERSALLGPMAVGVAVESTSQVPFAAGSAAASAVLTLAAAAAAAVVSAGRTAAASVGGISPVRGSSFNSEHLSFLPSTSPQLLQRVGSGSHGSAGPARPLTMKPAASLPVGTYANGSSDQGDRNVGARVVHATPASNTGGPLATTLDSLAGGSPPVVTFRGIPGTAAYRSASLPMQALPPPLSFQQVVSPFALPALQATSLARCSGTPLGGSPRFSLNGDSGDGYPGGCSPPLMPTILSVPGATSALQTVRECHPTDEADAHGLDNVGMEGTSTLASQRAVWCAPQALLGPSGGSAFQGLDSLRRPLAGPGTSAAAADADTAGVIVVRRVSGEYITGRVVAGGSGDLIGGSPGLGAMYLPGALGCETLGSGSINRYRMGGCGMSVTTGRPISGKLQVSAGSCTTAGMVVAAAGEVSAFGGAAPGTIGSDTSEDYCGVCFERPAFLHIKPCKHALCAECSREVTRMVETQPPLCPFCRGIVHGFGC